MKYLAIIPAYNSAPFISNVIRETSEHIGEIVVVDDGSVDGTADIALGAGADIVSHPFNKGKGAALKSGFAFAVERNFDAVITLDSDGQHDAKFIPEFIAAYKNTRADLIIGSRAQNKADMPWDRRLSNWLTSKTLSVLLRAKIEDSQCGYRLITADLLKAIQLKSERFQLETEIIIKAIKQGFKVGFVPITVVYGDVFPSYMNRFIDTCRWIQMVLEEI
jgi:glycosyltransferase involved in cell wall biosynthesis